MHMEIEEQKPKDTLLDREIKQKTEDFLENVKEEPKEECSQLIVPKLEEVVEASTSEEAYQLRHSSVLEQEEHKPKSLLEKGIKEEIDSCFEEIKEELVDKECYETFVPKLEKVIEPCLTEFDSQNPFLVSTANKNSVHNSKPYRFRMKHDLFDSEHNQVLIPTEYIASSSNQNRGKPALITDDVKLEPISDITEDSHKKNMLVENVARSSTDHLNNSDHKGCQMCLLNKNRRNMKNVTLEEDKLVLVIGYLLRNDCTLHEAKQFMSRKSTNMCYTHFSDAIDTICEALRIRNYEEIDFTSDVSMQNLMSTVNTLRPQVKSWEFREILRKFVWKSLANRLSVRTVSRLQKQNEYCCSVCSQMLHGNRVKIVSLKNDKLVIMTGCILRGACNPDQAQLLVSESNRIFICPDHFSEAVNEIYKRLDIRNPEEIYSCSDDLMRNLMVTVNSICPHLETSQFCESLHGFICRNSSQQRKRANTEIDQNQKKYSERGRCEICMQMQIRSYLKQVTLEDEKFIIMIGYILRGDYTIEKAKLFLSEKKRFKICHSHLVEVNNEIYKAIQITKPEEIFSCSSELIESMMVTVNAIDQEITIPLFRKYLRSFAIRNKKCLFEV